MRIEDIIENLNKHFEEKRDSLGYENKGRLVLFKSIKPHPTFKVYKTYDYSVFFVTGKKSSRVLYINRTDKEQTDAEYIADILERELVKIIFDWLFTKDYELVLKGEYGNANE